MLALVADHCLPDGITTLCPSSSPGMPIMAGTQAGDVFCLSLTKQVRAEDSTASSCVLVMQGRRL